MVLFLHFCCVLEACNAKKESDVHVVIRVRLSYKDVLQHTEKQQSHRENH